MNQSFLKYVCFPLTIIIVFSIESCNKKASLKFEVKDVNKVQVAERPKIPGPRTCFWTRGPASKDPYVNVAYPDAGVFYWHATFSVPDGARLHLEGEFPHSRYMSLISYDARGAPVESLADYLIVPNDGAVNPFIEGARRDFDKRGYVVEVVDLPPEIRRIEGSKINLYTDIKKDEDTPKASSRNSLNATSYAGGQQSVIYRIYVPDKGSAPTGGVSLPEPVLTLSTGEVIKGAEACVILKTDQTPLITANAIGVPMSVYSKLVNQPGKPDTWPATVPPTWFLQYDREFLLGIYNGQLPKSARKSTGGFYPNLDNNYVRAIINRKHGKVFVLMGKLPNTPKTYHGDKIRTTGELVYWSICSNQGFANTRVNDCLFDEQVPVNENGEYIIVISRAEDRPRNAYPECGIGWLPMADDGDGALDEDVTVVQIRNMLASPDFSHAIQNVTEIGKEKEIMGPYLPNSIYMMPNMFEVLFSCME